MCSRRLLPHPPRVTRSPSPAGPLRPLTRHSFWPLMSPWTLTTAVPSTTPELLFPSYLEKQTVTARMTTAVAADSRSLTKAPAAPLYRRASLNSQAALRASAPRSPVTAEAEGGWLPDVGRAAGEVVVGPGQNTGTVLAPPRAQRDTHPDHREQGPIIANLLCPSLACRQPESTITHTDTGRQR